MESEAPSPSSASPTHRLSTINADEKKSGGCRKRRRHPLHTGVRRRRRKRSSEMAHDVVHGEGATSSNAGESVEFVDEEAMFNMPLLIDCMAEAMLLTPPALKKGFYWTHDVDHHLHFALFHP